MCLSMNMMLCFFDIHYKYKKNRHASIGTLLKFLPRSSKLSNPRVKIVLCNHLCDRSIKTVA